MRSKMGKENRSNNIPMITHAPTKLNTTSWVRIPFAGSVGCILQFNFTNYLIE